METPERKPIQHFWKLNIKSFAKIWYAQKVVKDRSTKLERLEIETSEFKQINVLAYILQSIRPGDNTFISIPSTPFSESPCNAYPTTGP